MSQLNMGRHFFGDKEGFSTTESWLSHTFNLFTGIVLGEGPTVSFTNSLGTEHFITVTLKGASYPLETPGASIVLSLKQGDQLLGGMILHRDKGEVIYYVFYDHTGDRLDGGFYPAVLLGPLDLPLFYKALMEAVYANYQ